MHNSSHEHVWCPVPLKRRNVLQDKAPEAAATLSKLILISQDMESAEKTRATIRKNPRVGKIYCFSHGTVSWGFALNSSSFLTDLAAMDLWHIYLSRSSVNQGVLMVHVYLQHLRSLTIEISNLKSQNASIKRVEDGFCCGWQPLPKLSPFKPNHVTCNKGSHWYSQWQTRQDSSWFAYASSSFLI